MSAAKDRAELRAAASKGARRLDQRRPNWFEDIYTPGLKLNDCGECVCGQLYGAFDEYAVATVVGGWVSRLVNRGWTKVGKKYGFDLPQRFYDQTYRTTFTPSQAWNELTTAWKSEVYKRRRAARAAA